MSKRQGIIIAALVAASAASFVWGISTCSKLERDIQDATDRLERLERQPAFQDHPEIQSEHQQMMERLWQLQTTSPAR